MAQLSEWLQIMLAEIARKQAEALRDAEEQARRGAAMTHVTPPLAAAAPKLRRIAAG